MIVEYTQSIVNGEPGPNIFWMGKADEYRMLLNDIHPLGRSAERSVAVGDLSYVRLVGISVYRLESSLSGGVISKIEGDKIRTVLTCQCWREFIHKVLSISFDSGFVYQEFDDAVFVEDANVIMESSR